MNMHCHFKEIVKSKPNEANRSEHLFVYHRVLLIIIIIIYY